MKDLCVPWRISLNTSAAALQPYIRIARFDHWTKNVFVLPGFVFAIVERGPVGSSAILLFLAGILATGFVASANYVINEYLDSEFDLNHPLKCNRPGALGKLRADCVIGEYLCFALAGLWIAAGIGLCFFVCAALLLVMGILYNVQPMRTKDRYIFDVLSESINNPIRFALGWYILGDAPLPPSSILISYWMGGAFLMAMKRYAEFKTIGDPKIASRYRKSFAHYTGSSLLVAAFFYAQMCSLFLGVFLIKYRIEYVLAFPLVGLLFAEYLGLSLRANSAAQAPERLYRERGLMLAASGLACVLVVLMFVDIPQLHMLIEPVKF
jgi:4-hydroxybenzoate polyprenyltransferase